MVGGCDGCGHEYEIETVPGGGPHGMASVYVRASSRCRQAARPAIMLATHTSFGSTTMRGRVAAWDRLICVDWGKDLSKRRAWVAEVAARRVAPADVDPTLESLIAFARALPGRTLIAIDAALGVPGFYLDGARRALPEWGGAEDFLSWVRLAMRTPSVLREARSAAEWRHDRPFLSVPKGPGSLNAFWARCGGKLMRSIDTVTGAKSPFVVAGIPGTVGAGSRALWTELVDVLGASDLAIWPFDGTLDGIRKPIALAEIYPRVCYSLALAPELPARLTPLAKTSSIVRECAVEALEAASWIRTHAVSLSDLDLARADEDHFDAMISAAALLRCVLEGHPLDQASCDTVEGGILGLASVRFDAPRRTASRRLIPRTHIPRPNRSASSGPREPRSIACPIPGCAKRFQGGRGGWDAHVGAWRQHPNWHPHERDPERRKELFRREYPEWLG